LADEIEAGNIRALIVRLGNPALAIPGSQRLRKAMERLDLLVALDVVPTETTRLATHVLPMADHFERADVLTGYLQAVPFLRFAPAVVAPRAERRSQWWVFAELSRRLDLPLFGSARRDATLAGVELDDEAIAAAMAVGSRRPWDEVRAEPYGILDGTLSPGWLVPDRLPDLLDLAPDELVAQFESWAHAHESVSHYSGRSSHSFVMVNRRVSARYNSFPVKESTPTLLVHPDDADLLGLRDGDTTVITSTAGSCRAIIERTDAMRPGVVSLPHGFGEADVNRLTSTDVIDPLNAMPVMSGYEVSLTGPMA
jgi:anaerobic selenocysteine-containing dehydrogenase